MASSILPLRILATREGQQAVERLERRGAEVVDPEIAAQAGRIVEEVRGGGDASLVKAVAAYDGVEVTAARELRLATGGERQVPAGFPDALEAAIGAVERFHQPQVRDGYRLVEDGIVLEERRTALNRVGLYIPGGRFAYPSSVVMMVVPARLAGVPEIVVATPPRGLAESPALRFTLERLEVDEVWGMGGAHAIAALAYGTESIPRVDKILGPGNAWVAAAKQYVSRDVGVDREAGPTEVVIVADGDSSPELVAADLLAQAEHDPRAAAVLVTDRAGFAEEVGVKLRDILEELPTAETARAALHNFGLAFVVADWESALALVERIAPEHLQLVGPGPEALAERVQAAGAIFVGASTPEVFGDYIAGPSHVLPTCGTARYSSALGVEDFIRRSHCVRFDAAAAARWAGPASVLAEVEGLAAHAGAARRRAR